MRARTKLQYGITQFGTTDRYLRFNIKAVETDDGSLCGIARMTAKLGVYIVPGVCVDFSTDSEREAVQIGVEEPFFYGTWKDLKELCYSREILLASDLERYLDREFEPATFRGRRRRIQNESRGFYKIPLTKIGRLLPNKQDSIELLLEEVEEYLPHWLEELEQREVNLEDVDAKKGFLKMFSLFPEQLKQLVLEQGTYYTILKQIRIPQIIKPKTPHAT